MRRAMPDAKIELIPRPNVHRRGGGEFSA